MTRDSDRLPQGENSRSEVECEASQSGAQRIAQPPIPSPQERTELSESDSEL